MTVDRIGIAGDWQGDSEDPRVHAAGSQQYHNGSAQSVVAMGVYPDAGERRYCAADRRRAQKKLEAVGTFSIVGNG